MADKKLEYMSPDQKKGLLYGALIAAGLSAASGNNPHEAMINAAMGGIGAYSGGVASHYAEKEAELKRERDQTLEQMAMADHAIKKQRFDLEKRREKQYVQNELVRREMEAKRLIETASHNRAMESISKSKTPRPPKTTSNLDPVELELYNSFKKGDITKEEWLKSLEEYKLSKHPKTPDVYGDIAGNIQPPAPGILDTIKRGFAKKFLGGNSSSPTPTPSPSPMPSPTPTPSPKSTSNQALPKGLLPTDRPTGKKLNGKPVYVDKNGREFIL